MQSTCRKYVYVLVCATYVPSISQMHTVVLPGKMQVHQCIQEGYIQEVQERGGGSIFFFVLSFATFPLREAIYVYTRYVCLSSFLFPGDLHDSLDILWQPLRKSDNLCGSLAIPSQVYEHKGLNMMQQKHCIFRNVEKWGPDSVPFCKLKPLIIQTIFPISKSIKMLYIIKKLDACFQYLGDVQYQEEGIKKQSIQQVCPPNSSSVLSARLYLSTAQVSVDQIPIADFPTFFLYSNLNLNCSSNFFHLVDFFHGWDAGGTKSRNQKQSRICHEIQRFQ